MFIESYYGLDTALSYTFCKTRHSHSRSEMLTTGVPVLQMGKPRHM